jgi:hypothetical protein
MELRSGCLPVRALSFIGGVPELVIPDNSRALIANADRYEPRANDTGSTSSVTTVPRCRWVH